MSKNTSVEILVASWPNKEKLVGEIWCDNEQWALLMQEGEELTLEFPPRPSGRSWTFRYDDALSLLKQLRSKLLEEEPEDR
jgi:hypothetical protein